MLSGLGTDLRFAFRALRRAPGFTLTAVCTLALGVGATTTIFTVVDTVLLRPPPWSEPDRLVNVWTTYPHWRGDEALDQFWDQIALSYPEYREWAEGSTLLEGTAAYTLRGVTLTLADRSERISAGSATATLLDVLGVEPAMGRWFEQGEDVQGAPVAVISDAFWRTSLGADPDVVGSSITLDDLPRTVIGVLPEGFALRNVFAGGVGDHAVWLPIGAGADLTRRGNRSFDAIARLADGVTIEAALAETTPILRGDAPPERRNARMVARTEVETGALRPSLLALLGAAAVLLVIACLNVATMLLGESIGRRREIATRMALGAGRMRIVRQLLTESMLLGTLGAGLGALLALGLTQAVAQAGPSLPVARELAVNPRVLAFASSLGLVTGLLFGLAPTLSFARSPVRRAAIGGGRTDNRMQSGLIVTEVALTVVLLVGAGLLVRTSANLSATDPGFRAGDLALVDVTAMSGRVPEAEVEQTLRDVVRALRSVPGVSAVTGVSTFPLRGPTSSRSFEIEGYEPPGEGPGPEAQVRVVFPGYHETMGIPLVEGRRFTDGDGPDATPVVLVSRRLAERFWPDRSPIGARIRHDPGWSTVVGVVEDVRHRALDEEPVATYYVPYAQMPARSMTFLVETATRPEPMIPSLRTAVWAADGDLVVRSTGTVSATLRRAGEEQRYRALLTLLFATAATLLASVGIFGVTARSVSRRSGEMGLRVAMGARIGALMGRVVWSSVSVVGGGVLIGLTVAAALAGGLSGVLYEVRPRDPISFATAAILTLAVAALSSWLAGRRVARVDPAAILRQE